MRSGRWRCCAGWWPTGSMRNDGEIVDCGLWIVDCKAPSVRRPGRGFLLPLPLIPESIEGSKRIPTSPRPSHPTLAIRPLDPSTRFDPSTGSGHRRLNEPRGEAGKVLESIERPGAGATCERRSPLGIRSDTSTSSTNLGIGKSLSLAPPTRGVGGFPPGATNRGTRRSLRLRRLERAESRRIFWGMTDLKIPPGRHSRESGNPEDGYPFPQSLPQA